MRHSQARSASARQEHFLEASLSVLDALSYERTALTRRQIRELLKLDETAAEGVISVLVNHGFLNHDARRDVYIAGVRALGLAYSLSTETWLINAAKPALARIRDCSDETTSLTIRWGDYRVNIAQANGHHLFNRAPQPLKPLHSGSGGRILLSGMSDAEVAGYFERKKIEQNGSLGDIDVDTIMRSLQEIRRSGVTEGFGRASASFGAAVRDPDGGVIGGLVVSVPLHRHQAELRDRVLRLLVNGAEQISDELFRSGAFAQ